MTVNNLRCKHYMASDQEGLTMDCRPVVLLGLALNGQCNGKLACLEMSLR